MAEERCETTELFVSMCGCPEHRGGHTPEEEAAQRRHTTAPVPWRAPDGTTAKQSASRPFEARYDGHCAECGNFFEEGDMIQYDKDGDLVAMDCCGDA